MFPRARAPLARWARGAVLRSVGVTLLILGVAPAVAGAQARTADRETRTAGRVVRIVGRDTVPVPGIPVVLHRIGPRFQGPVDTAKTNPAGRFGFRFSADTGSAYLLSARHSGIEYFSSPVATNPALPDTAVTVIVADTSSRAPVSIRQRTILISAPDQSGTRSVLDWFVLSNPGPDTRVAPDTVRPSWGTALPPEAQSVELADNRMSQFAPEALVFRRDSALIFAPLSPGDKELMLQYRIPGTLKRFIVPADRVTDSVFVLLEERGGRVLTPHFAPADSQMLDGRSFRRWSGPLSQPANLEVALPSRLLSAKQVLALLVALFAAGFAVLAGVLSRRRARAPLGAAQPHPSALADAIARLDARYLGKQGETAAPEWDAYQAERARLKALLEAALATGPRRS